MNNLAGVCAGLTLAQAQVVYILSLGSPKGLGASLRQVGHRPTQSPVLGSTDAL